MNWDPLIDAARRAHVNAYAPYSGYRVGAAVRSTDSSIFAGSNVENRSFGATICAERIAIGHAVSSGSKQIDAVVVVTASDPPGPPCGMCLQVLVEFGTSDTPILLLSTSGARAEYKLKDFHPHPFELPEEGLGRHKSS